MVCMYSKVCKWTLLPMEIDRPPFSYRFTVPWCAAGRFPTLHYGIHRVIAHAAVHRSEVGLRPCSAKSCCKCASCLALADPSIARTAISCT